MTESAPPEPQREPPRDARDPAPDGWAATLDALRARHPGQKDSVLFCVHKLQQDPGVGLPDLRDEAAERGIPMAGRALHSAKVLLGMATAKPRRASAPRAERPVAAEAPARAPRPRAAAPSDADIEDQVLSAVRQLQSAAAADADRMRAAIRRAIEVLQEAIDDGPA